MKIQLPAQSHRHYSGGDSFPLVFGWSSIGIANSVFCSANLLFFWFLGWVNSCYGGLFWLHLLVVALCRLLQHPALDT